MESHGSFSVAYLFIVRSISSCSKPDINLTPGQESVLKQILIKIKTRIRNKVLMFNIRSGIIHPTLKLLFKPKGVCLWIVQKII
ncbi:hypothetical protein CIT14_10960 [Virgibacillus profundi]|nr:hypothetical protein CIT14_10960 [Virgibacillus profundi]